MARQTTARTRALVIISTFVVIATFLLLSTGSPASGAEPAVPYTVESGDTLWEIAEARTPAGADIRATVIEIKQRNGLTSSVIVPGQVLAVPAAA